MNKAQDSKCLLLNADYSPLKIISWQKAIIWSIRYQENPSYAIKIIEYYSNKYIQGVREKRYPVPLVAKTTKYFNLYNRTLTFSRKNLFIRDDYTCQYCGNKFHYNDLTYDHIIPKSRFYPDKKHATNWLNVTTACLGCNRKKSNKTPEQANMQLINAPKKPFYDPKYLPIAKELDNISISDPDQKEWMKYINGYF
jgi:5-methylcytosine-specific restriction endonuclease McrA